MIHQMTEEEQAEAQREAAANSQPLGEKSRALVERTAEFTLTVPANAVSALLPDWVDFRVKARRNSSGDGYHVATFEYDDLAHDLVDDLDGRKVRERLAHYVAQNGEDVIITDAGLDWRE